MTALKVRHWFPTGAMVSAAILASGCAPTSKYYTPERLQNGYVVILPGIEGSSILNSSLADGLNQGGISGAIEIHDWTYAGVLTAPFNLRSLNHNRAEGRKVAAKIIAYQDSYPGRPVTLIGHSGGGGVAVLALEALPASRRINLCMLLAPALAPDYDMRRALSRTDFGIWNYYSLYDVGWLGAGTSTFGTVDGKYTRAAGAVGFTVPWGMDEAGRKLYSEKLHQQSYSPKMAETGHLGGHVGWAVPTFVAEWLAPIIQSYSGSQVHYAADVDSSPG